MQTCSNGHLFYGQSVITKRCVSMRTKILTESKTENAANAIKHILAYNKLECLSAEKSFQPTQLFAVMAKFP